MTRIREAPGGARHPGERVVASLVAVVTGAVGRIGAVIGRHRAADGRTLACLDMREGETRRLAVDLAGARRYGVAVRHLESVHGAARRTRRDLSDPWLLVNTAGVCSIQLAPSLRSRYG